MQRKLGRPGLSGYLKQEEEEEEEGDGLDRKDEEEKKKKKRTSSSAGDRGRKEEEDNSSFVTPSAPPPHHPPLPSTSSQQQHQEHQLRHRRVSIVESCEKEEGGEEDEKVKEEERTRTIRRRSLVGQQATQFAFVNETAVVEEEEDEYMEESVQASRQLPVAVPTPQSRPQRRFAPPQRQRSKSTIVVTSVHRDSNNNSNSNTRDDDDKAKKLRSKSFQHNAAPQHKRSLVFGQSDVTLEILRMKEQFDDLVGILGGGGKGEKDKGGGYAKLVSGGGVTTRIVVPASFERKSNRVAMQLFCVIGIAIGHVLDGNVLAYTSPAIPSMVKGEGGSGIVFTEGDLSLIRSMFSIGATAACLLAGSAMSYLGRRGATLYVTLPAYALGFLVIGNATGAAMVVAGRFVTGVGLGMTLSVPTVYIVEITSPELRGGLAVIPNLFCQIGIFATYVAGRFMDWRTLGLACASLCLPFLAAILLIPESPVFLIKKGQHEKARKVLERLDLDHSLRTMKSYQEKLITQEFSRENLWRTWGNKKVVKPFVSGLVLMGLFQCTAFPLLMGNSLELFEHMSLGRISDHLANIMVGSVLILGSLLAIPLARLCDRKNLLVASAVGVSACLFVMATYFYLKQLDMAEGMSMLALTAFLLYIMFFMAGYGSVSWLVVAELLPPSVRSMAYPLAVAGTWSFNFVIQHSYGPMVRAIGLHGLLWFYAGMTACGILFVATCLPETRGRSAEEIERFYDDDDRDINAVLSEDTVTLDEEEEP